MSEMPGEEPLLWAKSTRSAGSGECVEIARSMAGVAVRDSKDPDGPMLRFSPEAWHGFIAGVRAGTFDRPGVN